MSNDKNLEFKAQATPNGPVINYAGNKNPNGKYAHGVQRFVTPVYRNGEKIGILMVGLDSIHILENMQHIRPLDYERLPLTDLLSGDYLALLDNEG